MPTSPLRQAPAAHAADTPVATIQKGANGGYWIVLKTTNGTHRWFPLTDREKPTTLQTLFNGETLDVVIGSKTIYVFKEKKRIHSIKHYLRYWVNRPRYLFPRTQKRAPPKDTALLIETGKETYVLVDGAHVAQFKTNAPVIAFDAPLGNSYMPYAYALTADRAYLLLESKWIPWPLVSPPDKPLTDPYEPYYAYEYLRPGSPPPKYPKPKATRFAMKEYYNAFTS
jgi:hypothetical protein